MRKTNMIHARSSKINFEKYKSMKKLGLCRWEIKKIVFYNNSGWKKKLRFPHLTVSGNVASFILHKNSFLHPFFFVVVLVCSVCVIFLHFLNYFFKARFDVYRFTCTQNNNVTKSREIFSFFFKDQKKTRKESLFFSYFLKRGERIGRGNGPVQEFEKRTFFFFPFLIFLVVSLKDIFVATLVWNCFKEKYKSI